MFQRLVIAAVLTCWAAFFSVAQAASFDCAKAGTKVEKAICADAFISKLDSQLGKVYDKDIAKANPKQKKQLITDEHYWLKDMRDLCTTQTCFKHAYWQRLAELETFYMPHSPMYAKASDKAAAIQKILKTVPLYPQFLPSIAKQCNGLYSAVKTMKSVHFVNPVVQVMSYEAPALEFLRRKIKKKCKTEFPQGAPISFSYACNPITMRIMGYPLKGDIDKNEKINGLKDCQAIYGLPPFKLFKLPPNNGSKKSRYIFYSDNAYGPMNSSVHKPIAGTLGSGFVRILPGCGNKDNFANGEPSLGRPSDTNYSSIIKYHQRYYYLLLTYGFGSYWLSLNPIAQNAACTWTSLKTNTPSLGSK